MADNLNDIFAHLDSAKASRAYETNQERRRKAEEAERERKVKQAAESAVEKYHVYDDDYDVENIEEPVVMIPKQNPGTPEAKAATVPASKKDMDDIADSNPFVQNLFKHSHKQVKQERPAREKPAADKNTAMTPQTPAAPASEPAAPQNETFDIPAVPVPAQSTVPSAPASTVAPAVPGTVDTVDFVDDTPLDVEFDDTEADAQIGQTDQSVQNETVPEQPVAPQSTEAVPTSNEPTVQLENVLGQEPAAFAAQPDVGPDIKEEKPEKNPGYHEPVGEMVVHDKKPEQLETPAWPDGMKGPKFTDSVVAYGSLPRKVGAEEANVFLFARYNTDKDMGSYGLCIDMGKDFVQSSKCGKTNNPEEYALMGAIEMLLALDEHTIRDVVIYTEPVVAKVMNENANRLLDGKSPVRRKYIELAWKAMTKVSVRFVTTKVNSEYGKLALATAKYLAFCER